MPGFRIGDHVRLTNRTDAYISRIGDEGTIARNPSSDSATMLVVTNGRLLTWHKKWTKLTKETRMVKFKKGDKVVVSKNCDPAGKHLVGKKYTIGEVNGDGTYELLPYPGASNWREDEISKTGGSMSTKFYKVIKDHPVFDEGAILTNEEDEDYYKALTGVFIKDLKDVDDNWQEGSELVEHQPEWFEQVYPIGKLEKMVFGNKRQAQAAAAAMYKVDKASK